MPPRRTPEGELDAALRNVSYATERKVRAAFRGADWSRFAESWPDISPTIRDAILDGQTAAIEATSAYLTSLVNSPVNARASALGKIGAADLDDWLDATPRGFFSRLSRMSPAEAATQTAGYVSGVAESEPFRVARESTAETTIRDPRFDGWARIAEPKACDFCRMLATRGAVYTSEESASRTFGGLKYHTRCKCRVVAKPRGTGASEWDGKGTPRRRTRR